MQVVIRTSSTVLGGLGGLLVLSSPAASSRMALLVVLAVATAGLGSLNRHRWRTLVIFTLMTIVCKLQRCSR